MSTPGGFVRRLAGGVLAAGVLLGLVTLSEVAWRSAADVDAAELRLSWRVPTPSNRQCRPPTEEELSGVAPHMRPTEVCTDEAVPFHLAVQLDGDTLYSEPVERAGRRARAVTVYTSFAVPPGSRRLRVEFLPQTAGGAEGVAGAVPAADSSAVGAGALPDLAMTLDTTVSAAPGDVILVFRDEDGRLVVAAGGGR